VKLTIQMGICLTILMFWGGSLYGQGTPPNEALFQKLQSDRTSGEACERFLKLGKKEADVRKYLTARLPEKIAAGPGDHIIVWENEVRLAGLLRIVEAIPSLIQHIGQVIRQSYSTFSSEEMLRDFPAGAALGEIGEPAVPALSSVLESGDLQKRWVASRALNMIEATAATETLSKHLPSESDPKLKAYIEDMVQRRRAGLPH
jgi:hypothetical protein